MAAPEIGLRPRVSLTVRAALSLIGFTAVIAQVLLMRELMVAFGGNELSLGLMLANWLLWTALGSRSGRGGWWPHWRRSAPRPCRSRCWRCGPPGRLSGR